MTRKIKVALTETRNVFADMPDTVESLSELSEKLPGLRDANINHHLELTAQAARLGARAVCFGELFTGPYFALDKNPMWRALAEDALSGPTIRAFQAAAKKHNILIVAPIYELARSSGKCFNTAIVIENDGSILGKYRKCHIPEGTNDAGSFHETFYYDRSDGNLDNGNANISHNPYFPVFQTSVGNIGIAICYDRHFPGVMKSLADQGAELVFSPAVTFGKKSRAMWEMEFAVDATRHNLFIGGSNRIGTEPPWTQEYFGASYFVGPNGRAEPISAPPGLVVAELDLSELSNDDPSGWNFERDLRSDIYSIPTSQIRRARSQEIPKVCLISDRLHLRPIEHRDARDLHPALSCPDTMRYWSSAPKTSVAETSEYIKGNVDGDGVQCFAITHKGVTDSALGWVTLVDKSDFEVEIGFILCPNARGKGLGKEAAQRVITHCFETRGLRRISADVDPDNAPSIQCLEALGMTREGHLRESWDTHIGIRGSLIYALLATD